MSSWVLLNATDLDMPHEIEKIGGTEVRIELSPFDIPEAVRRIYNSDKNICIIEFKYMGEPEPSEPLVVFRHENTEVSLKTGKRSKRLYRIEIKGEIGRRVDLTVKMPDIVKAIEEALKHTDKWRERSNYQVANKILDNKKEALEANSNVVAATG